MSRFLRSFMPFKPNLCIPSRSYSVSKLKAPISVSYEDYSSKFQFYDAVRKPVGTNVLNDVLTELADVKQLDRGDLRVLDAGCGSGLFIPALLDAGVSQIEAVEIDPGMLSRTRDKFESDPRVTAQQGSVTTLPLEGESMDLVVINQVLHHVDTPETRVNDYENIRKSFTEVKRVLKPGGVFLVNFATSRQCGAEGGFWYFKLLTEDALSKIAEKLPDREWMESRIEMAGFQNVKTSLITETLFRDEFYFDAEGPLKEEWRGADSGWALVSDSDLPVVVENWRKIVDAGNGDEELRRLDDARAVEGQSWSTWAVKPLA